VKHSSLSVNGVVSDHLFVACALRCCKSGFERSPHFNQDMLLSLRAVEPEAVEQVSGPWAVEPEAVEHNFGL